MRGMGVDGRRWWWRRGERVSHRSIAPVTLGGGRCDGGEGNTRPGGERVSVKSFNPFRRVRAHAQEFFARVYNIYIYMYMRVFCGHCSRVLCTRRRNFFIYLVPSKTFFCDYFFLFNFPVLSFRFSGGRTTAVTFVHRSADARTHRCTEA